MSSFPLRTVAKFATVTAERLEIYKKKKQKSFEDLCNESDYTGQNLVQAKRKRSTQIIILHAPWNRELSTFKYNQKPL